MKLVIGIVRPEKANDVLESLYRAEVRGLSLSRVQGHGGELDRVETYRGTTVQMGLSDKIRFEIAVSDTFVEPAIQALCEGGRTGEVGDGHPLERCEGDPVHERELEVADEAVALAEGERVADQRPGDAGDREGGEAHHEGVEGVLGAHQAGVEDAEPDRHQQDERGRDEHPGGVPGVDARNLCQEEVHHAPTGVTARSSVSPVLIRTTRSSGTTKILPSPTSPVRPPSQSAWIVGSTKVSETAISKRILSESPICTVVPR